MSRRGAAANAAVLVFGESDNDIRSVVHLIAALRPDLATSLKPRRRPLVLIKNVRPEKLPAQTQAVKDVVAAARVTAPVRAVVLHEDCDAVEPAHQHASAKIEKALAGIGCPAFAVTPAFEFEAWWFMWPDAARHVCSQWREPDDYRGRQVGYIVNAKEALRRALVPKNVKGKKTAREYTENDSPDFAKVVASKGWAAAPRAQSGSYQRLLAVCGKL